MATAYERLARIRDRAVEVRDSLPIGSVEGELYTELVDALEAAILEVTTAEPEKEEKDTKALIVPDMIPQGFAVARFINDCFNPLDHQMAVWS